jgi:hypothetical protein
MPFGKKLDPSRRFEIDFDEIYELCIQPAADEAGVDVIRADEETLGGIIHKPMYERLLLAEIVVADLTLANANVFYELGIRHAARPRSTILIHAKIGQLPFDVAPIRAIPYPLDDHGQLAPADATALHDSLAQRLEEAKQSEATDSPLFQLLADYPGITLPHEVTEAFRDRVRHVSRLTDELRAALQLSGDAQLEELQRIGTEIGDFAAASQELPLDLLLAYRGASAWNDMVRCVERMPPELARVPTVREQLALALNRRNDMGDRQRAIEILEQLLTEYGPSPETNGILGRVYKDIWEDARTAGEASKAQAALDESIQRYGDGFDADPRDYYPGINLITLLVCRGRQVDLERVEQLRPVVMFAVGRRGGLASPDYWDVATVLELSVLGQDWALAERASGRLQLIRSERWMLDTTARNLTLIADAIQNTDGDRAPVDAIIADLGGSPTI